MVRKLSITIAILLAINSLAGATTYYIRMSTDTSPNHPGNNSNNGTSWQSPWADLTHLNDGTFRGGDTVFFGTGTWRSNSQYAIRVIGGTASDYTVYACSSFAATNGAGESYFAHIWHGLQVTGWNPVGSNVYVAPIPSALRGTEIYGFWEGDNHLMWKRSSRSSVTGAGMFYENAARDSLYCWTNSGGDPDNYDMEATGSTWKIFEIYVTGDWAYNMSYVQIYGFDLAYCTDAVKMEVDNRSASHIYVDHCRIHHGASEFVYGANESLVSFMASDPWHVGCRVRACILYEYYVQSSDLSSPPPSDRGKGIEMYNPESCIIDSNYFLGGYGQMAIWFKKDSRNTTIRYNTFTDIRSMQEYVWAVDLGTGAVNDSVYGNIFYGVNGYIRRAMGMRGSDTDHGVAHDNYFYNNTIYYCRQGFVGDNEWGAEDYNIHNAYNIYLRYNDSYDQGVFLSYPKNGHSWLDAGHLYSDSNLFFDSNVKFVTSPVYNPIEHSLSEWQNTFGFDRNSSIADPGFANPTIGDFSRPNAGQEMNLTYGGRTWTRFGAVQSNDPPPPPPPLAISNVRATNITYNSVTINWNTNIPASSQVEYGLTNAYGSTTTLDPALVTAHAQNISGLTQSTTYHYRVRSRDANNNEAISGDYTFTTAARDITPPTISNVQSSDVTDISAVIHWQSDEAATSRVNYGLTSSYGQSSDLDNNLVLSHVVPLTGLQADTIYHFRVRSSDAAGNEAVSSDYTFRTDTTWNMVILSVNVPDSVSGTYAGYSTVPINDGVINPRGGINTTWASDQNSGAAHWVEMTFDSPKVVRRARLLWAWNNFNSSWMCSQQYIIQYWDNSNNSFVNAAVINNGASDSMVTTDFPAVTTSRVRYWQPANMGPPTYPSIVWLTELQFFGSNAQQDTIPPAAIRDLNALPADGHGNTRLFWTAPGDDGGSGLASSYAIRYSQESIDETNWIDATLATNPPYPINGGSSQEFTVGGLTAGATYFWAIKAYDEVGNASELSNSPEAYASGISPPALLSPSIDPEAGIVTLSSNPVESYFSLFYEFELDVSQAFDNSRVEPAFLAGSLVSATFDNIQDNTEYYCRCRAMATGRTDSSDWSPIEHFNLSGGAQPVLADQNCLYPAEGDVVSTSQPSFTVIKPDEAINLYFQVDEDMLFGSPIFSGPVSALDSLVSWRPGEPLEHAGAYYWRASLDGQTWTSPISFTAVLEIHAFPNPFRAGNGNSEVTFCNLPQDASLTIATISGSIVKTVDRIGSGSEWSWDLKNDNGQIVASGVYLYQVSYHSGSNSGKVMIIR